MKRESIIVKIGKGAKAAKFPGVKLVWEASDAIPVDGGVQIALPSSLTPADAIKRLNYAEDLFVRRDIRTEHTESGVVTKRRTETLMAIAMGEYGEQELNDLKALQAEIKSGSKNVKELNAHLDRVYSEQHPDDDADDEDNGDE